MAYYFYLGKTLLPVAPQKLQLKIKGVNKTYTLINDGEINILKTPGLTDIEFDALLPNVKYPFAVYKNGFTRAKSFLEVLKNYKQDKKTFQFIVTRTLPNGKMLFDTNMKVSLESNTIKEDAKNYGMDVMVTIKLIMQPRHATSSLHLLNQRLFHSLSGQQKTHQSLQIRLTQLSGVTAYGTLQRSIMGMVQNILLFTMQTGIKSRIQI